MCNIGNKDSEWIEEHHANRDTTQTNSYKTNPYLKPIEQPNFRQRISPIASQSVMELEIEKVSGIIESLLGEPGHISDVSDRDSLTPSPRTNMVVQRQHEHQDFAGSLQQPQVLDLSSHSHDIRQHLTKDNQQEPPVANFQQIDQQTNVPSPQQIPNPQIGHQPTAKSQQGSTAFVASSKRCAITTTGTRPTPKASPASTWGQQLGPTYTTTTSSFCASFLTSTAAASTVTR
ncbi:Hypothetical predicted protein [Mytilus galloprovincialis]|uniref:Uncharacterized protein n=1 Tax=Mytilus galloprovincialis TaxID=29158 RepID=A0A8B6CZU4_MYTGA|nr:Hypothetical predicted protein [Mytilus galloprovincialis]